MDFCFYCLDFNDFDLFETCEEYYDDGAEFEAKYADDDVVEDWEDHYYYDAFDE